MTAFYFLSPSKQKGLLNVQDYASGNFDVVSYWKGADLKSCRLEDLQLFSRLDVPKNETDLIANPLGLLLTSERLYKALKKDREMDSSTINIFNVNKRDESIPAYVLNPLIVLDNCLDDTSVRLQDGSVWEPILIASMIPPEVEIFRVSDCAGTVFLKKSLADKIGRRFSGLELVCVGSVLHRTKVSS